MSAPNSFMQVRPIVRPFCAGAQPLGPRSPGRQEAECLQAPSITASPVREATPRRWRRGQQYRDDGESRSVQHAAQEPDVEEADEKDLEVGKPKEWAAGIPGVLHSMQPALKHMGVSRTEKTLLALNQKDGFDCMSCAWPDPDHRKTFEFCENGAKAVTWEATPVVIASEFWAEHPGQRTAAEDRVLARDAGPPHGAGLQAGGGGPLPARELGRGVRDSGRQAQRPGQLRTRPLSTPAAGRRTRPPSSTSCSCGPSAPTTCRTAPTCATNRPAGPWARPSASARPPSPTTTSPRRS